LDELKWNDSELIDWQNRNIGVIDKCNKCRYSLLCGGECYAKVLTRKDRISVCNGFPDIFVFNINKLYQTLKNTNNI
jgi:uncharacterized protein